MESAQFYRSDQSIDWNISSLSLSFTEHSKAAFAELEKYSSVFF